MSHAAPPTPDLVLFDRDGTLVVDVPYNGDPRSVVAVNGARQALDRLRSHDVKVGIITNQSGIGRRLITRRQAVAVNRRVRELLGEFDVVVMCPHVAQRRCPCRKPRPGMVHTAARRVRVDVARCAVVGDIGSDVAAGAAAGARPVLVPSPLTRREEILAAPEVAVTIGDAVELLLAPVAASSGGVTP